MMPKPLFFATPAELRAWFDAHHQTEPELLLGFYGKGTGRPSVTWPQAVDEAIRVGWIDGQVRRIDETSHTRRFTPRRAGSIWSTVNVEKAKRLIAAGEMRPAGLRDLERRVDDRSGVYSYEQATEPELGDAYETALRGDADAWTFFSAQPPGYRRAATWWGISAKREQTRERRIATLIEDSAAGRSVKHLTRPASARGTSAKAP